MSSSDAALSRAGRALSTGRRRRRIETQVLPRAFAGPQDLSLPSGRARSALAPQRSLCGPELQAARQTKQAAEAAELRGRLAQLISRLEQSSTRHRLELEQREAACQEREQAAARAVQDANMAVRRALQAEAAARAELALLQQRLASARASRSAAEPAPSAAAVKRVAYSRHSGAHRTFQERYRAFLASEGGPAGGAPPSTQRPLDDESARGSAAAPHAPQAGACAPALLPDTDRAANCSASTPGQSAGPRDAEAPSDGPLDSAGSDVGEAGSVAGAASDWPARSELADQEPHAELLPAPPGRASAAKPPPTPGNTLPKAGGSGRAGSPVPPGSPPVHRPPSSVTTAPKLPPP